MAKAGPRRASASKLGSQHETPRSKMASYTKEAPDLDLLNQSSTSFHSAKQLDQAQREKLQKQAARPFVVGQSSSAQR